MANPYDDDAWIEAELERELAEMESIGDSEEEDDDGAFLTEAPREANTSDAELADSGQATGEPSAYEESLRELMACLADWRESAEVAVAEDIQDLREAAADVEGRLRAPPKLAWGAPALAGGPSAVLAILQQSAALFLGPPEKEALADLAAELFSPGISREVRKRPSEEQPLAAHGRPPEQPEEPSKLAPSTPAVEGLGEEDGSDEVRLWHGTSYNMESPKTAPAWQEAGASLPSLEELGREIEAMRLARVEELEREEAEALRVMKREAEERKAEQDRLREEMAMHTEELRCQDFYQTERSAQRREARLLAAEDRFSRRVREEERKARESAERGREAMERAWMYREDEHCTKLRRWEKERRESASMAEEDTASRAFNEHMRRREETARLEKADEESRRWAELERRAFEAARMAAEDERSFLFRESAPLPALVGALPGASGDAFPRAPSRGAAMRRSGPVADPADILAALCLPPLAPASSSTSRPPRPSAGASADEAQAVAAAARERRPATVIDVWAQFAAEEAPAASRSPAVGRRPTSGSGRRSGAALGGSPGRGRAGAGLCGGALCPALQERARCSDRRSASDLADAAIAAEAQFREERPLRRPSKSGGAAVDALELFEGLDVQDDGLDGVPVRDAVRLEVRMESLPHLPRLHVVPHLRILNVTGNKLTDLDALRDTPLLEELVLDQNRLTSLRGVGHLQRLVVLRAVRNELSDAEDLASLQSLRHVDLSINQLRSLRLSAPGLMKLQLQKNRLTSLDFLEHLPSLAELHLGENQLASLDARISTWNPLLLKVFLWRNSLTSLPELRLPLLTDLSVDNNRLEALGTLGFLPSLERLSANYNKIEVLGTPVSASPLLHTLQLAFNALQASEAEKAVPTFPRLRKLQLNDNPAGADLMEAYRPWALRLAPQLEELDNEVVEEPERIAALSARYAADPYLPHVLRHGSCGAPPALPGAPALRVERRADKPRGASRLGGLFCLIEVGDESSDEDTVGTAMPSAGTSAVGRARGGGEGAMDATRVHEWWRDSLLRLSSSTSGGRRGTSNSRGCAGCALAMLCEPLAAGRAAALIALSKEERAVSSARMSPACPALFGAKGGTRLSAMAREEALLVLRRRRDFWRSFLQMCREHLEALANWRETPSSVVRLATHELFGGERRQHQVAIKVQARWRGVLGRRRCRRLRLELLCQQLPAEGLQRVLRLQATWRGATVRTALVAGGMTLPKEMRRSKASKAAVKIQAAVRGHRWRKKLHWARNVARMADDPDDLPEIDVGDFLGDIDRVDDFASPFMELRLPPAVPASRPAPQPTLCAALPSPGAGGAPPKMAWSTPPPSAGGSAPALVSGSTPRSGASGSPLGGGRPGSAASSSFGVGPRRSRSMSSTAESAVLETEGNAAQHRSNHNRVEQVQEEWRFQDAATAQMYLRAQRHRLGQPKPPPMPHLAGGGSGRGSRSAAAPNGARSASGTRHRGQQAHRSGSQDSGKKVVKAQDGIAEFRRQQEEQQRRERAAASSPESPAVLEFRSGSPNLKLARSSRGFSQQLGGDSPRLRSPGGTLRPLS